MARKIALGLRILMWTAIALALWLTGVKSLDPDFGWHFRIGRILIEQGTPRTDPFSYTMPSWPWVDHGRGSDMLIGALYPVVGMEGLAVIYTILVLLTIWVAVPRKLWIFMDVPVMLGVAVFLSRAGVRPQVVDWLFLAMVVRVVEDVNFWRKWRWVVPVGFAVWANIHGGWAIGLAVLGIAIGIRGWEKKKWEIKDILTGILSIGATLLTPYGTGLWHEVWLTMSDASLKWKILEWQPFYMNMELGFWLLVAFAGSLLWRYRWELPKWRLLLAVMVLVMAGSGLRHMSLAVVVLIPMTAWAMRKFNLEIEGKYPESKERLSKFYIVLLGIVGLLFIWEVGTRMWGKLTGRVMLNYPEKAVEYISEKKFSGELVTEYGWGGYVIWKLPERKTFIDGRMPSWRWDPPNENESASAFDDFDKVTKEADYQQLFEKYDVGVLLVPVSGEPTDEVKILNAMADWLRERGLFREEKKETKKTFLEKIEEEGWNKIYEDEVAVVWVRPNGD